MIRAILTDGSLILGLSRANTEKLQEGKPIILQLSDIGLPRQKICIMYGDTEQKIMEALSSTFQLSEEFKIREMKGDGFEPNRDH